MSMKLEHEEDLPDYKSYLLRLWRVDKVEDCVLVSLESIHTGKRRGFSQLEDMVEFLQRQMALQSERSDDE